MNLEFVSRAGTHASCSIWERKAAALSMAHGRALSSIRSGIVLFLDFERKEYEGRIFTRLRLAVYRRDGHLSPQSITRRKKAKEATLP